ncbi:MAG: agmatinase family protein [Fluviicola sp.]|jgi:agmatinase
MANNSGFDPNGVGIANGNIFGFPVAEQEADLVIIPVPWDATASYGKGTSEGPQIILDASTQLDFYHPQLPEAWNTKVFMTPISEEMKRINDELCVDAVSYIDFLEQGGTLTEDSSFQEVVQRINATSEALRKSLKERASALLKEGKIVAVLGGEHSTPFGLIEALNDLGQPFGILQIDAHADLRDAYEGFQESHASIMHNVVHHCDNLEKLVQVGIRDVAASEVQLSNTHSKITTFFDWEIKRRQFEGENWKSIVDSIIRELPQRVYISFDIDGLHPSLCPHTGTPVAGGFELEQIAYLFFQVIEAGKEIVGFDLNEVAPGPSGDWDANVGARALWNLVCATEKSRRLTR